MDANNSSRMNRYSFFLLLILFTYGCNSSPKTKPNELSDEKQGAQNSFSVMNQEIKYLLPSPNEIITVAFNEKINFKPELCLEPNAGEEKINSNFQTLILGAYLTDFSYCLIYNDINKSSKYLEVIKSLTENSGLIGIFEKNFFDRVERNVGNIDSLLIIYRDFSECSFNLIAKSAGEEKLSLLAMGASIEAIYLGYNVFKDERISGALKPFFVEQRVVFENFFQNYLFYNASKSDLEKLNTDLEHFYSQFKLNIWLIVGKNKVSDTDSGMTIDVKYNVKVNSGITNELGLSINKIRERLVSQYY